MKSKILYFCLISLIGTFELLGQSLIRDNQGNKQIILLTIPKCGTYLLTKCLRLLGTKPNAYHLTYNKDLDLELTHRNVVKFFIYRDPRDQVVSLAYWLGYNPQDANFDSQLLDLIVNGSWAVPHISVKILNVADLYKKFMPWKNSLDVYTVRFEDLIGPLGGGTEEAQLKEIKNIARHCSITLRRGLLKEVSKNLFGTRYTTFREGKIGSWKTYFTPKIKEVFKSVAGQLLVDLGYEKDLNW